MKKIPFFSNFYTKWAICVQSEIKIKQYFICKVISKENYILLQIKELKKLQNLPGRTVSQTDLHETPKVLPASQAYFPASSKVTFSIIRKLGLV